MTTDRSGSEASRGQPARVSVRKVRRTDLERIVAIDTKVTGIAKDDYWHAIFHRYGRGNRPERHFLVAEFAGQVVGFVIGEVRDWEFGEPPCGWVFAIDVQPEHRLHGVASVLLRALCDAMRRSGVRKLRTILARDDMLILSFFRSQGMRTGPFVPLEMDLDD